MTAAEAEKKIHTANRSQHSTLIIPIRQPPSRLFPIQAFASETPTNICKRVQHTCQNPINISTNRPFSPHILAELCLYCMRPCNEPSCCPQISVPTQTPLPYRPATYRYRRAKHPAPYQPPPGGNESSSILTGVLCGRLQITLGDVLPGLCSSGGACGLPQALAGGFACWGVAGRCIWGCQRRYLSSSQSGPVSYSSRGY